MYTRVSYASKMHALPLRFFAHILI